MTPTSDNPNPIPDTAAETVLLLRRLVERNGTWALCKVFAALALWLGLHLTRAALVLVVRILTWAMARADRYATTAVLTPPTGRVNHYFDAHNAHDYDAHHFEPTTSPMAGHGPPGPRTHWEHAHA
ncbi:hypothetical protein OHS58_48510 [Amycolatopsis sp. NBC_00348]|uniref:hypothetical protein n=1 Tax=unclassified Amycolatopsis TaxID=2618356 RepID=UPI002E268351|nr:MULTISPECIES: hypothetical protein [unclassified Amycolatopsis]